MSNNILWGIWGAGDIARVVASDLCGVTGAKITAIGSRTEQSARALASEYGVRTVTTDLQAMLDNPAIDVMYLATPHHLHARDAIKCLQAGKAVLCEKPLAVNAEEVGQIVAAARESKRFCMEAMWTRFIPAVQHALQMTREGAIGKVVSLRGDFSLPVAFDAGTRFYSKELGGGALLDRGVYLVSLAQAILGEPVRIQSSVHKAATRVDAHSAYLLEYANGAIAAFSSSLIARGSNTFTIEGERGSIVLYEPFVCAHRIGMDFSEPFRSRGNAPAGSGGAAAKIKSRLKKMGLQRRLSALRAVRRYMKGRSFVFSGNGYQFELEEVMSCMRSGKSESAVMPLEDSLAIARTLDRIKSSWS